MTDDHALQVFDEPPLVGRKANTDAWHRYIESYPDYIIHPHCISADDGTIAILGHTTGSHLDLPDADESRLTLIWVAEVVDAAVRSWTLIDDDPDNRRGIRLDPHSANWR